MNATGAPSDADKLRGLLMGLVLGDALGVAGSSAASGEQLRIGVASQLSCFTADALVRGVMRDIDKGLGTDRALLVWLNDRRWATLQGLPVAYDGQSPKPGDWQDWLARVPAFTERRGSAPATAAAIAHRRSFDDDFTASCLGAHGVVRALPLAVGGGSDPRHFWVDLGYWSEAAARVARLTHAPEVGALTALATTWVAFSWSSGDPKRGAVLAGLGDAAVDDGVHQAVQRADDGLDAEVLAHLAPDRSARSALTGGAYAALSCADAGAIESTLTLAASAPRSGPTVAAVAGAVLGAAYGAEAFPAALIARLEVADEVDQLARDLATALGLAAGRDLDGLYPGI